MIPLRTDSPLRGTPWMNWAIIAVNILVFLLEQIVYKGSRSSYALSARDPHLWQYFTYQFEHSGGMHIAGNMLFLYIFGNNVNDRMGNWGYLAFYLAGGIFGGIAFVLTSSSSVIGASGAVAAVTGAFIVLLPRSHVTILYWFFMIGLIELPSVYLIMFSFVKDFIGSFGGDMSGVAHSAHLGGSVFGFSVSFILLACRMLPRDQFDLFALFQRWNRRRQYTDMVRSGFDPFDYGAKSGKGKPDPQMEKIQDLRAQISESLAQHKPEEAARVYLELHAIDPQQVLSRQTQLDVANQLYAQETHAPAAAAYEGLIRTYPKYDQIQHVHLMLGLLYSRYLNRPDLAKTNLETALLRLSNPREVEIAKAELAQVQAGTR